MLSFAFIAVGCVSFMILFQNLLLRVGATLTAAALGIIAIQARRLRLRDGQASEYAAENGVQSTTDFLRSRLERRRERHRGWRFWIRWVMLLPGPITFFFGFAQARPDLRLMILFEFLTFLVAMVAAIPLNRQVSRNCERRIRALNQLRES
jgi:hypothetical protein